MPVARIDSLYLVQKEVFVELDNLAFPFASCCQVLVALAGGFVGKVGRQAAVPVHPLRHVLDALTIEFSLRDRVGKHLLAAAGKGTSAGELTCRATQTQV